LRTPRIGSFLAQFDDTGHLQKVIERETAEKSAARGFKVNLGGGATVLGTGGSGNVGLERGPGVRGSEASERIYDPLWTNARTLLDYLDERDMIERDLARANIGQFVLASGSLEIRDLNLIKKAMPFAIRLQPDAPTLPKRDERNRSKGWQERKQAEDQAARQSQFGLEFLALLPHAVHAQLNNDGTSVWCSLKPDSLVVSSDDIFLKHGVGIPGLWHMLGVLDARPDPSAEVSSPEEEFAVAQEAIPKGDTNSIMLLVTRGFGGFIDGIAPFCRLLLGRPSRGYGLTPLVIFREVTGR
jgi:hypothetical protein